MVADNTNWIEELPEFREKAESYFNGDLKRLAFYSTAGKFGVNTQRGDEYAMLRLRMPGGLMTKTQMLAIAGWIREYDVPKLHLTTGQTLQLHNLTQEPLFEIMEKAIESGILTVGMGGHFARNIICTPLTGLVKEEPFDILPYALATDAYTLRFLNADKHMPAKLKLAFSNQPDDIAHATFHDMGYVALPDGTFDIYSGGGLGPNPMLGIKVGYHVDPSECVYYAKAMWLMFTKFGNYEEKHRSRARYMQETLGGEEGYRKVFMHELEIAMNSEEDLHVYPEKHVISKTGDGVLAPNPRVVEQKQPGLYSVCCHPVGGCLKPDMFCRIADAIADMEEVEARLSPEEEIFFVNLTASEVEKILAITDEGPQTLFDKSVSCVGKSICQFGARDSQKLLRESIAAVREAGITDGALPQVFISGCPSACSAHLSSILGFRGGMFNKKPSFLMYAGGCAEDGKERVADEIGYVYEEDVPAFLVKLGKQVEASGKSFAQWLAENPDGVKAAHEEYLETI